MTLVIDRGRLLTFALACCVALCDPAWAGKGADLILTNGHVYTADPKLRWAEAVAIKAGKIVYVGSTVEHLPLNFAISIIPPSLAASLKGACGHCGSGED